MALSFQELKETVAYNKDTGALWNKLTGRPITIDPDGKVLIYYPPTETQHKHQARNIIYKLFWNIEDIPFSQRIYHVNMKSNDFRPRNLRLTDISTFKAINEAYDNLVKAIKLSPHPKDRYSFIVEHKKNGIVRKKVFYDIIEATKEVGRLRFESAKLVTAYCVFDEYDIPPVTPPDMINDPSLQESVSKKLPENPQDFLQGKVILGADQSDLVKKYHKALG
jgi:hypothetical protein